MINKQFNLYTNLNIKELILVIINKDKSVLKEKLILSNNKYTFNINIEEANYFYFLINKTKSDFLYPDSLSNDFELKYNKKIHSYSINIYSNESKGEYTNYFYYANNYKDIIKKKQKVTIYKSNYIKSNKCGLIITFDGQNAFYKGNYKKKNIYEGIQLDVLADILSKKYHKDYIVLALDNASIYRSRELTMSKKFGNLVFDKIKNFKNEFTNTYLESYMEFINNDILEDIFSKYDIDKNNIGIVGASSGGLASFYSTIQYSQLYSFAICLSPAFPLFRKEDIITFYKKQMQNNLNKNKIYLYSGNISKLEKDICNSTIDIFNELHDNTNLFLRVNRYAKHNEVAWRIALTEGLKLVLNLED